MEQKNSEELLQNINQLMLYVNRIRESGALDLFSRLFQSDLRILSYLRDKKDVHPSIIARDLRLARPNVAANLRLLESKKLISRVGDCDNHRQVIVNITPLGQRYLMIIDQQMATLFVGWFSVLGKEETGHLFKILELSSNPDLMTDELKKIESVEEAKCYLNALKEECDTLAEEEEDNSYLDIKKEIENYEKTLKV